MTAVRQIDIDHRQIHKASHCRRATSAQTALLNIKEDLEIRLSRTNMDDFSDRVMDSDTELLHIREENGQIWLSVVDHRLIDVSLDELGISEEEQAAILEQLCRLAPALKAKKGSVLAQAAGVEE